MIGTNAAVAEVKDSVSNARQLFDKINKKQARTAVVGLGYVGLPLVLGLAGADIPVTGIDVDEGKLSSIRAGTSYLKHIPDTAISGLNSRDDFKTAGDFTDLAESDVVVICLPTPLNKYREPDLSYVTQTLETMLPYIRAGQLFILESTTWPGTTREVVIPVLERSGLTCGEDFFVAFSPEREDPGNKDFNTHTIPKVVGGHGVQVTEMAQALYGHFIEKVVVVSSPDTAEAVKLTENIFRSINIALVNELKVIYDAMGIDVWEVIDAAKTKPFGFMPFYPGPGLGGHCIPIDPFYLTWKAREFDINTRFIELAGEIINHMPHYVVSKLSRNLDLRAAKSMNGAKILMIGMAYKRNVDDMRETPALKVIELLEDRGAQVAYHDPFIPVIPQTREHPEYAGRESVALTADSVAAYDAVVIVTDHDDVDYGLIVRHANLVVDTRNATADFAEGATNIVKA